MGIFRPLEISEFPEKLNKETFTSLCDKISTLIKNYNSGSYNIKNTDSSILSTLRLPYINYKNIKISWLDNIVPQLFKYENIVKRDGKFFNDLNLILREYNKEEKSKYFCIIGIVNNGVEEIEINYYKFYTEIYNSDTKKIEMTKIEKIK